MTTPARADGTYELLTEDSESTVVTFIGGKDDGRFFVVPNTRLGSVYALLASAVQARDIRAAHAAETKEKETKK